ncbi:unnamed protein product [Paramecium sonneborni]|uniref:Protein kinase domain-containing protein n=1 Tax=Paramecium sonneborni TaxID=65129 RepID=A0A8S1LVL9_9CILI|nr:unnamed protein product [Paramecium sonneborni]
MLCFFLLLIEIANCGDIQVFNQYGTQLQDKILIITKNGMIYNYDLKNQQILWVQQLEIALQSEQVNSTQYYIQPYRDGTYLLIDDFVYEIEQDDINLLFRTCSLFQNSLVYNNNIAYFLDIETGNLKKLNQFDVKELLKKPKLYQQGVLIYINQQYISNLEQEFSLIYNSKIYMNFLLQYIRGNQQGIGVSNNTQIWKTQHGIHVNWNNKTFDLYLDNEVFQVYMYDNLEGLYSLPLKLNLVESQSSAIISISDSKLQCENQRHCLINNNQPFKALDIYKQTELKQCLNQFYKEKFSTLPIVYQQSQPQNLESCFEIYDDNDSITMLLLLILLIAFVILVKHNYKKQKLTLRIRLQEQKIEQKYIQQNQIQFNQFEILGQGSQGTIVYEGIFNNQIVAVKDINLLNLSQSMVEGQLERSFKDQMSLNSHKFLKLYFYEKSENHIYLAMEKGLINLKEFVKFEQQNKLNNMLKDKIKQKLEDPEFYKECLYSLLIGLAELEKKQIKHHGLDYENIIFNKDIQILFSDLGTSLRPDYYKLKLNQSNNNFLDCNSVNQQLGVIFYYLLSKGDDLKKYSEINQKMIVNKFKKYKIKELDLRDLILQLLFDNPINKQKNLLLHPYFWNKEKKLKFICEFSDYVETSPQEIGQIVIQERFIQNKVFQENWGLKCEILLKEQNRRYDQTQALQLIRLIRNTKNHYHQLTSQCKTLLGKSEKDLYKYWNKIFPNLFFTIYQLACENNLNLLSLKEN